LSIGDGLVAQIPALITSVAAGMLVTRAASKAKLHDEIQKQLFFYPRALAILSAMLIVMGLVPGLPMFPFVSLGVAAGLLARNLKRSQAVAPATAGKPGDKTPA